jgi:hypothetical protein
MLNEPVSDVMQDWHAPAVDSQDVGEVSDVYATHADREAVHDLYESGNEVAAEKNEPVFDNRVGFTNEFDAAGAALDEDVRTASHFDNGQYGEGGKSDQEVDRAIRHHMLPGDTPDSVSKSQPGTGPSSADKVADSASDLPKGANLNNPDPLPPSEVNARRDAAKPQKVENRTNDSSIDPTKPKQDILKGFHGG